MKYKNHFDQWLDCDSHNHVEHRRRFLVEWTSLETFYYPLKYEFTRCCNADSTAASKIVICILKKTCVISLQSSCQRMLLATDSCSCWTGLEITFGKNGFKAFISFKCDVTFSLIFPFCFTQYSNVSKANLKVECIAFEVSKVILAQCLLNN